MSDGTARLLHRLELVELDRTEHTVSWRGEVGENAMNMSGRLFGGMVMAQTVTAAGRTAPDRRIHSLQQVFLRGGQPDGFLDYHCETLFTGRTYASLRVEVRQHGELISHAQVGLTAGVADGPAHERPSTPRGDFADSGNRDEYRGRRNWRDQPVETRAVEAHENDDEPRFDTWLRPYGPIPGDEVLHQAVLAFVTDRAFMTTAWKPARSTQGPPRGATLDHTIWFHRPVQFDDWHVFSMEGTALLDGRGLSRGMVHRVDTGELVASVAQQGALRRRTPPTT